MTKLDRLRARYERAVTKRKRVSEIAARATMRLSDAEEAEAEARALYRLEQHFALCGSAACVAYPENHELACPYYRGPQ